MNRKIPPAVVRCSTCSLANDCKYKTDDDMPCVYKRLRWEELDKMFEKSPKRYSIWNLKEIINKALIELEKETELDKKRELTKISVDALERLHRLMFGTKTTQEISKVEVDVNELVRQAMEAEKKVDLVDSTGATLATVTKEKK